MSFFLIVCDLISPWVKTFSQTFHRAFQPLMSLIIKVLIDAINDRFVSNHKGIQEYPDVLFVKIDLSIAVLKLISYFIHLFIKSLLNSMICLRSMTLHKNPTQMKL